MSFLDDIKEVKATEDAKRQVVIDEICEHFQKQFDDGSFEKKLKERIVDAIKENKNHCELYVEFWNYTNGCSDTNFSISCCSRFVTGHGWDGRNYKGFEMYYIAPIIVEKLRTMLKEKIFALGLSASSKDITKECWLNYPKYLITVLF